MTWTIKLVYHEIFQLKHKIFTWRFSLCWCWGVTQKSGCTYRPTVTHEEHLSLRTPSPSITIKHYLLSSKLG